MSRDHLEVGVLVRQLEEAVHEGTSRSCGGLLYGLYHLIRVHFAKEEGIDMPLLDQRLGPEEARELFRATHPH
jgi:hypothetical protein